MESIESTVEIQERSQLKIHGKHEIHSKHFMILSWSKALFCNRNFPHALPSVLSLTQTRHLFSNKN